MPIDFHAEQNRGSYAAREADSAWAETMRELVDAAGRTVLDIGCGGGIYTRALSAMGAARVIGVDFSEEMLKTARERCSGLDTVEFVRGNALATGLPDGCCDIILERALIHHVTDLDACFTEAMRLLKPGGMLIVQDRTPEDCLLPGTPEHLRGYLFSRFPKLIETEVSRRHDGPKVRRALAGTGFAEIAERQLWETRRVYADFGQLEQDLLARTGRSILHELTDEELAGLAAYIKEQLEYAAEFRGMDAGSAGRKIVERDRWTVWTARKPAYSERSRIRGSRLG